MTLQPISHLASEDPKRFEAALFVLRKKAAKEAAASTGLPFYVCPSGCFRFVFGLIFTAFAFY